MYPDSGDDSSQRIHSTGDDGQRFHFSQHLRGERIGAVVHFIEELLEEIDPSNRRVVKRKRTQTRHDIHEEIETRTDQRWNRPTRSASFRKRVLRLVSRTDGQIQTQGNHDQCNRTEYTTGAR